MNILPILLRPRVGCHTHPKFMPGIRKNRHICGTWLGLAFGDHEYRQIKTYLCVAIGDGLTSSLRAAELWGSRYSGLDLCRAREARDFKKDHNFVVRVSICVEHGRS
jgi:hypothetical protein